MINSLQSSSSEMSQLNYKQKFYIGQMFSNAYQNGPTLEVWDAKVNIDKNPFYKQLFKSIPSNSTTRYFDKEVKSYIYSLQGQNARVTLPSDDSKLLALHQRFLVLHIFVPIGFSWAVEFVMSDLNGTKRRVNITTTQGKQEVKYFSFRYPIDNLQKGVWLFLAIDIFSFMTVFKGQTFRSVDQISISSSCRLRRIFTMKEFVEYEIPKNYWLAQGIPQEFQLLQMAQQARTLELSKNIYVSPHSPVKAELSPLSNKKDYSPKMAKSDDNRSRAMNPFGGKRQNMLKSQSIIEQARNKLENLSREQQKIINMSKQLSKKFNESNSKQKQKSKNKIKQQSDMSKKVMKNQINITKSKKIVEKQQLKVNSKLPSIEKSFKEDSALNVEYEQSSNYTQQAMKAFTPKTPKNGQSRQVIQQDQWSDEDKYPNRPISEAISNMTGNFPSTIITKQNQKQVVMNKVKQKQLQLIYDQMVGCYYHPESNTYYEIKH